MKRAALVVVALVAASPCAADIKTPEACAKLARLYGFVPSETYTREQAEQVLAQLDWKLILVPDARQCRSAIKREINK